MILKNVTILCRLQVPQILMAWVAEKRGLTFLICLDMLGNVPQHPLPPKRSRRVARIHRCRKITLHSSTLCSAPLFRRGYSANQQVVKIKTHSLNKNTKFKHEKFHVYPDVHAYNKMPRCSAMPRVIG